MKAILSAPGSRGDVNPMIAIGRNLKRLGYDVVISVAAPYAKLAEEAGLTVEPVISESTFTEAVGNAEVWHPVHGPLQIFRVMIRDFLAKHRRVIEQHSVEGQTVLVAHPLDLVSRIFREADPSMLLVGVHLQPVILRTYRDPPRLSPWWFEPRKPSWLLRGGYALLDHLVIDAILRREILSVRSDLGVQAPLRRIMDRWWLSPDATMALYPSRFAPATVGFCNQLVHCGFPLEDVSGSDFEVPSGSPVVFTSGTANRHCRQFFEVAVHACKKLKREGILLSSYVENFPENLPSSMQCHSYRSLSKLLPHCSAIVHHGGVGTTSQAFAAGIPQVIRPLAFDQFDNAERVEKLGCGRWLKRDSDLVSVLASLPGLENGGKPGLSLVKEDSITLMQREVAGTSGAVIAADRIDEMARSHVASYPAQSSQSSRG